jgi:dihydrodipicolinate synthase/N-acetylneuraminate lyase
LFVCGTFGSAALLSPRERRKVLSVVVDEAADYLAVTAHVGCADTATTVDLARHAERTGAHAVAAVIPYYHEHTAAATMHHFSAIVEAVSVPVFVYDYPKAHPTRLTAELLADLAAVGVAGIKDSGNDLLRLDQFKRKVNAPSFQFVVGTEALLLPAMLMGCRAAISGLSIAFPEQVVRLYEAAVAGDMGRAAESHDLVMKMRAVIHRWPHIPAMHEALRLRGIDSGFPRRPFLPLSPEQTRQVMEDLVELGVAARDPCEPEA